MENWKHTVRFLAYIIGGVLLAYLLSSAKANGMFIEWERTPELPGKATKLYGIDTVEIESGDLYRYSYRKSPEGYYWESVDEFTPILLEIYPFIYPLESCSLPNLSRFTEYHAFCVPWSVGSRLYIIAIDEAGDVYKWERGFSEGDILLVLTSSLCGGFFGLMVGIVDIMIRKSQPPEKYKRIFNKK